MEGLPENKTVEFPIEEKEGMAKIVSDRLIKLTSRVPTKRFLKRLILLQELADAWRSNDDVQLVVVKNTKQSTDSRVVSSSDGKNEILEANGETTQSFCCEQCGLLFRTNRLLSYHAKTHATGARQSYRCTDCGKDFTRAEGLRRHASTHSRKKPCVCSRCGKQFSRTDHLLLHMRTHTGEKPYTCNECGKRFSTGPHLKKHLGLHEKDMQYVCNFCSVRFPSMEAITLHLEASGCFKCS